MSNKLIIINSLPTSKIFGEKVDAWWYQNNGFEVEFWDVSPIFWSKEKLDGYYGGAKDYRYIGPSHCIFSNQQEVLASIADLKQETTIVWYLSRNDGRIINDEWLLQKIKQIGLPLYFKKFETDPSGAGLKNRLKSLVRPLRNRWRNRNIRPEGYIGCGRLGRKQAQKAFLSKFRFVSVPTPMILWKEQYSFFSYAYHVFVDENIIYAPDAKMLGFEVSSNPEQYYRNLNAALDQIEKVTGVPVIIAASGKYSYKKDFFQGRQLVYGKTLELIQHAELVIGHASGALVQAIASKKPILQLVDPTFNKEKLEGIKYDYQLIDKEPVLSTELSKKLIQKNLYVDNEHYEQVEFDFFREPGIERDYREIIAEAFLSVSSFSI